MDDRCDFWQPSADNSLLAVRDRRTRDGCVLPDGEMVEVDEKLSNGCRYPGDPEGSPSEVYNCRCAMRSKVDGADPYSPDLSRNHRLGGMSYDEWKEQARERVNSKSASEKYLSLNDTIKKSARHNREFSQNAKSRPGGKKIIYSQKTR